MVRPKADFSRITHSTATTARNTSNGRGTPRILVLLITRMVSGKLEIDEPLEIRILIPFSRVMIPSVAKMGETRTTAIKNPMTDPITMAMANPAASTSSMVLMPGG